MSASVPATETRDIDWIRSAGARHGRRDAIDVLLRGGRERARGDVPAHGQLMSFGDGVLLGHGRSPALPQAQASPPGRIFSTSGWGRGMTWDETSSPTRAAA